MTGIFNSSVSLHLKNNSFLFLLTSFPIFHFSSDFLLNQKQNKYKKFPLTIQHGICSSKTTVKPLPISEDKEFSHR